MNEDAVAPKSSGNPIMSTIDLRAGQASSASLLLPVFATTIFLSATLLFSVQPMFTKMVLPLLGGSPSVWSVAMVFFQAVLLAGYGYAHAMTHALDPRRVALIHLGVFAFAFTALPIAVAQGWGNPPADYQAFWLIGLFGASIGLPFFAVAANAPLIQAWFARTGHPQAHDPYFLYGASNLGSFASLLAYPFLLEPALTLRDQSALWSAGFGLLGVMIAASAVLMSRNMAAPQVSSARTDSIAAPAWADRAKWVALSFVPSALLVAVTSHISTDIASAPFLWVIPLALYLLTFVLTFRASGDGLHVWMVRLQPIVAAPLVIGLMGGSRAYWFVAILLSLGTFVISTMICHRELYLRRPDATHLTGFYMWVSAGGVLGGIFSGLFAPFVFPDVWEYPILIVLALMCRPGAFDAGWRVWARDLLVVAALITIACLPRAIGWNMPAEAEPVWMIVLVMFAAAIMLQAKHASRLVALSVLVLALTAIYRPGLVQTETARSFFGVHKVVESADGKFRMLYHGTTLHGAQQIRDAAGRPVAGTPEPLTYYYRDGLFAEVIRAAQAAGKTDNVASVGLGAGSLACYARPGESWTFFEIDPEVVRIARDPAKFSFLTRCAPQAPIVLGDARLTLARQPGRYGLIMLDAFSSDVVPVHLLTREALGGYLEKLAPGGVMAFHISNRYLELASVVREVAATHGLAVYLKQDRKVTAERFLETMHANSLMAVMARREEDLSALVNAGGWTRLRADGSVRPWTDDYSDILSAIWRMRFPPAKTVSQSAKN
jgi:hypothetical protein